MAYLRDSTYWLEFRWRDYGRLRLTTGTGNKTIARDMGAMVRGFKRLHRLDVLGALRDGQLTVAAVFAAHQRGGGAVDVLLMQAQSAAMSPAIGPLVDRYLAHLGTPAAITPQGRRYAPYTPQRYRYCWHRIMAHLPAGPDTPLAALNEDFVRDYRATRRRCVGGCGRAVKVTDSPPSPSTLRKDLAALTGFLRWCAEVEKLPVPSLKIKRPRVDDGRMTWLDAGELQRLRDALPPEWWALFALLAGTGLRLGEALGLRGADVRLADSAVVVSEAGDRRRVKSAAATRVIPLGPRLRQTMAAHLAAVGVSATALVFPAFQVYADVRRVWLKATKTAALTGVHIHDLRHCFGVHAIQQGVPLPRLQYYLGHASPLMTLRYAKHAPGAYGVQDAAAVEAGQTGAAISAEDDARRRGAVRAVAVA